MTTENKEAIVALEKPIAQGVQEALDHTLPPAMQRLVNGKIDNMRTILEDHIELRQEQHNDLSDRLDTIGALSYSNSQDIAKLAKKLDPFVEAVETINNISRFFSWIKTPLAVIMFLTGSVAVLYAAVKGIFR